VAATPVSHEPVTHPEPTPAPGSDDSADEPAVPIARPGRILLSVDQPSQITLDGKVVADSAKSGTYDVPAGTHTIEAKAPGHETVTRTLDLESGGTAVVEITNP
jgi:hypothetical protein